MIFTSVLANAVMPGFHYYALYERPESAILGMQAHVDLIDTIGELIVTQPRSPS